MVCPFSRVNIYLKSTLQETFNHERFQNQPHLHIFADFDRRELNYYSSEPGSHVHGNAELNVVLMEKQLQVEFVSPAINLLGFERPPSPMIEIRYNEQYH